MSESVSSGTKAILLLTAPLITGKEERSNELLTAGEYNRLVKLLANLQRGPADLLGPDGHAILDEVRDMFDGERLSRLLERGFLLTMAIEKWQARSIWVVGREDSDYPSRIKARLGDLAPPVMYGCGDPSILDTGGLAIVGSRNIDDALAEYTASVAGLAAGAGRTVVSGGARGIDQSAMGGALRAGGNVTGVLADSLSRQSVSRDLREYLMDGRLVLVSPWDPAAGFNVGNAMNRNKMIYALADAALVVSSDYRKGGTWSGAVEQLEKYRYVPLFVRTGNNAGKGIKALQDKGAMAWPDPQDAEALSEAMMVQTRLFPEDAGMDQPSETFIREQPDTRYNPE